MSSPESPERPADPNSPPPQPAPRKRRRWPKVLLGLVILIVVLIALAPTIISTATVRGFIASKASDSINGSVKIDDLSLGWFSGTRVGGVKIYNENNELILELDHLSTELSLLGAIRGNYNLGDTLVDANLTKCIVYADGSTNYDKLAKSSPKTPTDRNKKSAESKLPNVSGNITVKYRGTISGPAIATPIQIDPSTAVVKIADINQPISDDITLAYRVGDAAPASITLSGTVDAIENNKVIADPTKVVADQKLAIKDVNLAAAAPFLNSKATTQPIQLAGVANGDVTLKADGKSSASAIGAILVTNLLVSGQPLSGDTYKSAKLNVPINVSATATDANTTLLNIQKLSVETDQATVSVNGKLSQQALNNLAHQQKPGAEGALAISVNVTDIPTLAAQLPHLLKLQPGVKVTSGKITANTNVALAPETITVTQDAYLEAAGTNADKPIKLDPINLKKLQITEVPGGQIGNITLDFQSPFATAKTARDGQSLDDLAITGTLNLAAARQQAAQFSDLGTMQLSGDGDFALNSKGDIATKPAGSALVSLAVNLRNLVIQRMGGKDLNEPRLSTNVSATLLRADNSIKSLSDLKLTTQTGPENAPVIDVAASAKSIAITPVVQVEQLELAKLNIPDLARAQQQYGGFVPALNDMTVTEGQFYATVLANYANDTLTFVKPLSVSVPNLSIHKVSSNVDVLKREKIRFDLNGKISTSNSTLTADLSQLKLSTSSKLLDVEKGGEGNITLAVNNSGALTGSGQLRLSSNLKSVSDLRAMMGGAQAAANSTQLTGGLLDATLTLNHPANASATSITLDGGITSLSVTTPQQPISNEKVTVSLAATSPDDFSKLTIHNGSIASSFANTTLGETIIDLKASNLLDKLVKSTLEIAIPDLARTYALVSAFSPPAVPSTQRVEPLAVLAGASNLKLDIARSGASTTITAPAISLTNVSLQRGTQKFQFEPNRAVNLQLAASVATNGTQIQQVQLTQLSGDLAVAKLEMPKPITIAGLGTNALSANGTVKLTGALRPVTALLAVLQAQPQKPYLGDFTITQEIATQQANIRLAGDVAIPNLQTDATAKAQNFAVKNDVVAENFAGAAAGATKNLQINTLSVAMPDSNAVGVTINNARLVDIDRQRQFQNFAVNVSYDLAQLWPLIKPMLSPESQKSYEDLKIAGQFSRDFHVAGSYPGDAKNFADALHHLKLDGALAVQQLETSGLSLSVPDQPFTLADGSLITQKPAQPSVANKGTLDLSGIALYFDPNTNLPLLSVAKKHPLMRDVQLNPILASKLGGIVNIVFKDASEASGLMNITVNECRSIPITDLAKNNGRNSRADFALSITNLHLNGYAPQALSAVAQFGGQGFNGEIRDAALTLHDGTSTSDLPLYLVRKSELVKTPLRFAGDINFATNQLHNYNVTLPAEFFGSDQLAKAFPQGITIPLKGTLTSWALDESRLHEIIAKSALQNLLGGNKSGDKSNSQNPLDILLGGGKKDQSTPPATPTPRKKKKSADAPPPP